MGIRIPFFLIVMPVKKPVIAAPIPAKPKTSPTKLSSMIGGGPERILDVHILIAKYVCDISNAENTIIITTTLRNSTESCENRN